MALNKCIDLTETVLGITGEISEGILQTWLWKWLAFKKFNESDEEKTEVKFWEFFGAKDWQEALKIYQDQFKANHKKWFDSLSPLDKDLWEAANCQGNQTKGSKKRVHDPEIARSGP